MQKNSDIFNILMEALGDKAADHIDAALQKAAKEDLQLAESAYVMYGKPYTRSMLTRSPSISWVWKSSHASD